MSEPENVTTKRLTVPTEKGDLIVEIVAGRPESEPYIWIGDAADRCYFDSIDADGMRLLLTALKETLGETDR